MKSKDRAVNRRRIVRFTIAIAALACAFAITVHQSRGRWQFAWNPQSLLAQPELEEGAYDLSSIVVLNRVLLQLQENYVDVDRFEPRWMLAAGLNEIQNSVAEIVATFDRPLSEGPTEVTLQVGDASKRYRFGDIESLWEMSLKFKEIFRFIQENLGDEADPHDIEYAAINGLLRTLDPHSVLLDPETYRDMLEGNRGNFGGLGIVIRMIDGQLTVVKPMGADTPAVVAGIKKGDRIVQIEDQSTVNMDITDAVNLLRGEPGTSVKLYVVRDTENWTEPRVFDITRSEIKIPSVYSADLGDGIGYVRLSGFQGNTHKDMVSHLETLSEGSGGLKGLVLDLRGNPGGLLEQAIEIADEFLDDGTIVTTVGSGRRYRKPYPAHESDTQPHYPIVLLIDANSASASEIVAGALKNYDRALVVGETSFGKGSVQVLYELQDGSALKLTIAQYLTPGDVSIQSVGIVPDIKLVPLTVSNHDMDIIPKRWVRREANLKSHLDHESARRDQQPAAVLEYVARADEVAPPVAAVEPVPEPATEPENGETLAAPNNDPVIDEEDDEEHEEFEEEDDDELDPSTDPQVRVAKQLLTAAGSQSDKRELLAHLRPTLDAIAAAEDEKLVHHLTDLGVDWAAGPLPTAPDLAVTVTSDHADARYRAGEKVQLQVTVTNRGSEPVYRVSAVTEATTRRFEDQELIFGRIDPGQSVTRSHTLEIRSSQRTREDVVDFTLLADDGDDKREVGKASVALATQGAPLPHLVFSYAILDDTGNGDGLATPGEELTVRIYLENIGEGTAKRPMAFLKNLSGAAVYLLDARQKGGELRPGQRQSYDFRLRVQKTDEASLTLQLNAYDRTLGSPVSDRIAIPVVAEPREVTTLSGVATVSSGGTALRAAPVEDADVVALLSKGDQLTLQRAVDDQVLVTSGELAGWLPRKAVQIGEGEPTGPVTAVLDYRGYAPMVKLSSATLATTEASVAISGSAEDDHALRDLYVFVYSEKDHVYDSRKVAYRKLEGTRDDFELDVPLREGMNRVKLVTRDADGMEAEDSVYIYRGAEPLP